LKKIKKPQVQRVNHLRTCGFVFITDSLIFDQHKNSPATLNFININQQIRSKNFAIDFLLSKKNQQNLTGFYWLLAGC